MIRECGAVHNRTVTVITAMGGGKLPTIRTALRPSTFQLSGAIPRKVDPASWQEHEHHQADSGKREYPREPINPVRSVPQLELDGPGFVHGNRHVPVVEVRDFRGGSVDDCFPAGKPVSPHDD